MKKFTVVVVPYRALPCEAETYADPLILEKYDITREQFFEIASKLEDEFAVGGCG